MTTTSSGELTARHTSSTYAVLLPTTAAIPDGPVAAACMSWPRLRTMRTASANCMAPLQTRAVYSPRLWPARTAG